MSTQHFGYYEDWQNEVLTCSGCGWSGTVEQGAVEYYEALLDCRCPVCDCMLAIFSYPTLAETEANYDKLSESERQSFDEHKAFLAEAERTALKSSDRLPDVPGVEFVLSWDIEEDETGRHWTKIKHDTEVIWSELAYWEGWRRFLEVLELLRCKYGDRLKDLIPTDESGLFLYGDCQRSLGKVREARARLGRRDDPNPAVG